MRNAEPSRVVDGFLPRARRLAERTGATWPAAYERASVQYFERMTGATI